MKFILYSSFLFLLAPCNAKKAGSSNTSTSNNATNVATGKNIPSEIKNDLKTVSIIYHKTHCFGTCPVFTLTISGETNLMTYEGDVHVEKLGTFEKSISDEELSKLVKTFDKNKYFELKDIYPALSTDFPSKMITYSINGKTKKIDDRQNPPAELKELEKLLDEIADSEGWKKIKDHE